MQSTDIVSSGLDPEVLGLDVAVPEIEGAVLGFTSSMSIGTTCDSGTNIDSDFGLGLIDDFLR
jgi:hypothetical protein